MGLKHTHHYKQQGFTVEHRASRDAKKKKGFPDCSVGKESACNVRHPESIPGSGRSTAEGIGYPLQYSWASLVAQLVKNLPAIQETWV